jgi:hypothetical protein
VFLSDVREPSATSAVKALTKCHQTAPAPVHRLRAVCAHLRPHDPAYAPDSRVVPASAKNRQGTSRGPRLAGNGNRRHLLAKGRNTFRPFRFVLQVLRMGRGDPRRPAGPGWRWKGPIRRARRWKQGPKGQKGQHESARDRLAGNRGREALPGQPPKTKRDLACRRF